MIPDELFRPSSVAVVGASAKPGKVARAVFENLVAGGFPGAIYGVNPRGGRFLGREFLPSVDAIPGPVDLGIFVVPPDAVLEELPRLAARGMRAAVVLSAGFKESGPEGAERERKLRDAAARLKVRILGPNCLGIIDPGGRLNASFAAGTPPPGSIAFFSQSGALCAAILDWALGQGIGFSKFISLGNEADIAETEVLEFLAEDPGTRVILGYLESVGDGRRFLECARRATARKPVVLMKAGSTVAGARAASSHTGSLAGSDRAYGAAFRQAGILRAASLEELFDLAVAFALQPLPAGERLLVVTNAGGPGILAADAAEALGVPLAEVSRETREQLARRLPASASLANPIDVIGDAKADRYREAFGAARGEAGADAVLVLLTPQAMTEPEETARAAVEAFAGSGKTALASFLGEASVRKAREILAAGGIPHYFSPERAVRAFRGMTLYRRRLSEPDPEPWRAPGVDPTRARRSVAGALAQGRKTLGEEEGREILEAYGFRFPARALARTSAEAVSAFRRLGGPVAMKVVSRDLTHKTDVGGVRLSLGTEDDVREAFLGITASVRRRAPGAWIEGVSVQEMVTGGRELILGMSRDPQFGPLLLFGLGGIHVELLGDVAVRIAPVDRRQARDMIREIRAYPLLAGFRGSEPVDEGALEEALLRLSGLALDVPQILELDINPLIALPRGREPVAIDCRMTIEEA